MEAATIERQVAHLVSQLEGPRVFCERCLVIDSLRDGFVRQHSSADMNELIRAAERLRAQGFVDRVIVSPGPGATSLGVMKRWFDVDCEDTHSVAGAPLVAPLWAIEQCIGEYVLQVDSDILIQRASHTDDYLAEMIDAMERTPNALTASLSVPQRSGDRFTPERDGVPWRLEVRGCLLHRARLLAARPFSNRLTDGKPTLSWHRALDQAATQRQFASLRGGSTQTAFVHPPNELKSNHPEWMLLLDLIEKYPVPHAQIGRVDLVGGPLSWSPRNRSEAFVFVVTGRNVPPGRMARCLESIVAQHYTDWGAVIIDDGSASMSREALQLAVRPWRDRITLMQPRERRGQLANMTLAIRHVCSNPNSVIVTLDLDDALIGQKVLDRIAEAYSKGAEVTVGTMLRTDKHQEYPVTFESPRQARGGNVWQHLRTFRKYLFDAIPDQDLRVGNRYADIAVDWTFMLPIVEMANRRAWIRDPLYLYEPSGMGKGADWTDREAQIASIMAKQTRRPRKAGDVLTPIAPEKLTSAIWKEDGGILFVRHGERPPLAGLNAEQKDAVHITEKGRSEAVALGRRLGHGIHIVSSPVLRAVQTAAAIASGVDNPHQGTKEFESLVKFRLADTQTYDRVKARLGWAGLMSAWMDGSLFDGILIPCHTVASTAVRDILAVTCVSSRPQVVAVTHDFVIMALLASLRGVRTTAVPYLGGVFVSAGDARSMAAEEYRR
jgi:broad specificity phosphatase PhoE